MEEIMQFVVVRHAEAEDYSQGGDSERPLAPKGISRAGHLREVLGKFGYPVDLILSSGAKRCKETGRIAAPEAPSILLGELQNMATQEVDDRLAPLYGAVIGRGATLESFQDHQDFGLWVQQGRNAALKIEATAVKSDAELILVVTHAPFVNVVAWALEGERGNSPCLGPCPTYGTGFRIQQGIKGMVHTFVFPGS
ncbi:MAG: histidine phosphatase family protein [Candidatus Wildermuthbacteria bacterium]|nr:histidine phosphatase family protein [Candidatus Wildermuthbacteria bacterium]